MAVSSQSAIALSRKNHPKPTPKTRNRNESINTTIHKFPYLRWQRRTRPIELNISQPPTELMQPNQPTTNSKRLTATPETRRRRDDFLDPDFGVKASLNLASRERSKCRLGAEADSEIPELGLDSGRLSVDCDLNPNRVADVAYRAAKSYAQYRRDKQRYQSQPTRLVKRRRTQINIQRDYERSRGDDHAADEDVDAQDQEDHRGRPHGESSSAAQETDGEIDEDEDD